jgi:hypothetical protein
VKIHLLESVARDPRVAAELERLGFVVIAVKTLESRFDRR